MYYKMQIKNFFAYHLRPLHQWYAYHRLGTPGLHEIPVKKHYLSEKKYRKPKQKKIWKY